MTTQPTKDSLSIEPLTLTNPAGTDFDISIFGSGFLIGLTPSKGESKWAYIDRTQATALREWLSKVLS